MSTVLVMVPSAFQVTSENPTRSPLKRKLRRTLAAEGGSGFVEAQAMARKASRIRIGAAYVTSTIADSGSFPFA